MTAEPTLATHDHRSPCDCGGTAYTIVSSRDDYETLASGGSYEVFTCRCVGCEKEMTHRVPLPD